MSDQQDETTAGPLVPFDDFADEQVRHVQHNGRWYFSIIDVIALLTESEIPRHYWRT